VHPNENFIREVGKGTWRSVSIMLIHLRELGQELEVEFLEQRLILRAQLLRERRHIISVSICSI
jgi:hypothetical protein